MTTNEIVAALNGNSKEWENALKFIYLNDLLKGKIIQFVQKYGGNAEDGEDLFQEGIIAMDKNIRNQKFKGNTTIDGYLFSICRYLWFNHYRKNHRLQFTEEMTKLDQLELASPEKIAQDKDRKKFLEEILQRLGQECKQILQLWRLSYSMKEIKHEMKLSSEGMARKKKHQCYKRLCHFLNDHPNIKTQIKSEMYE